MRVESESKDPRMSLDDQLTEVFDRGLRLGVESLSDTDRELFRIQDFILEFELNELSGYLYNRLPDIAGIDMTIVALRGHGFVRLADLLHQAVELFRNYREPDPPSTWGELLKLYDPEDRISLISKQIHALDAYL
jgi:hypothetical protein